jgi:quercetin dioxygenase-like cupin family protein
VVQAHNHTAANVVALVSYVLPDGAPLSVPQPNDATAPPRPSPGYQFRTDGLPITGPYDVLHMVQDYPPGAASPLHTHPGQVLLTVLEGEITFRVNGTEQVFKAGESFVERPNELAQARNVTASRATLMATALLPRGVPLATVVTHPPRPLPATGVVGAPVLFPETGYSLEAEFLGYWQAHGGLPVFGYPITSARQVDGQVTQWLERARFELHSEHPAPYTIQLGRLGVEALERQNIDWRTLPKADPRTAHYVPETGHAIAAEFWDYWRAHGLELGDGGVSERESLALFGYPISTAQVETNSSGQRVLTQWFERARFEYHPTNLAPYRVLLGRLGAEMQAIER